MLENIMSGQGIIPEVGTFLYGLFSSIHCIGMCGGIVLAVTTKSEEKKGLQLGRQAAYHSGRVLTGMIFGFILGSFGRFITVNEYLRAMFPCVCGLVLLFIGLVNLAGKNLHVFDCQGKDVAVLRWIRKSGPFAAGVLTPLLPCAMLSPVHIFAAGTGSAWRGALCMATFILGTTPALFLFGSSNALLTTYARKVTVKISGAVTMLLGAQLLFKAIRVFI